jgi:hypothetical protein
MKENIVFLLIEDLNKTIKEKIKMTKKLNHKQFAKLIEICYKQKNIEGKKVPMLVYGTFGVGKSAITRQVAEKIASERGRIYIEWNKCNSLEKDEVFKNLAKYFVFLDNRLSEMDTTDSKGIPDVVKEKNWVEWIIPSWARILENPDSDGILFFDEINLATPLIISSCYKIIHDRVVNESKINDNWLIMGCGNKDDDRAYTHDLASPMKDRCCECELTPPSVESWCEWAINGDIDGRIIGFVNWKPSALHNVKYEDGQKYTTERGWERLNTLIKGETDFAILDLVCGTAIGEGIAREFLAFCKIKDEINFDELIKNPSTLKRINDIGVLYFVVSAIAEKYKDTKSKIDFSKVFEVSAVLDEMSKQDFIALLWRLCSRYDKNRFRKDFTTKELNNPLREKFYRYLVED